MEGVLPHADNVLEAVRLGKWQLVQYTALLTTNFTWATGFLAITILGFLPDFACLPTGLGNASSNEFQNLTFDSTCSYFNDTVNTSEACLDGFVYIEPKEASIVSDWDLVCGLGFLSDLSQTMLMIGVLVGTVVFSPIADRYGRRKVLLWCQLLFLVVSLLNCLVPNITWFIVARFFIGLFIAATGMAGWVLTLEQFIPQHRTMAALISNVIWSVCTLMLPAIGYLMKGYSWRYVQLALSLLALNVVIQFLFVDEAIRWLMANGRNREAVKVIRKAAKQNGVSDENISSVLGGFLSKGSKRINSIEVLPTEEGESTDTTPSASVEFSDKTEANVSARALITHPKLRRITLVMFLIWFTNALTYVGLYMLSMTMSGDKYLNLFLSSIPETPAALLLFPVVPRCGRRKVLIALHSLAAVSLIGAAILHVTTENYAGHIALTIVIMLGKFSIAATFNLIYMYTPELYPTNIRSVGVGVVSIASRIGGLLSPFAATVARAVPWVPSAVFGGFCLLVALSCPLLPETRGKDLPQTLADLEKLYTTDSSTKQGNENVAEMKM